MARADRSLARRSTREAMTSDARQCVMVIDDDNTIRAMLQTFLERRYTVVGLSHGEEALEFIESYKPNLLILDINLPGSDGFEICRSVRSKAEHAKLPILFMTVRKDDKSFLDSLDSGGNSFITKPFEMAELKEKIEYLLRGRP